MRHVRDLGYEADRHLYASRRPEDVMLITAGSVGPGGTSVTTTSAGEGWQLGRTTTTLTSTSRAAMGLQLRVAVSVLRGRHPGPVQGNGGTSDCLRPRTI